MPWAIAESCDATCRTDLSRMPRPKTPLKFRAAIAAAFRQIGDRLRSEGKTPSTEIARVLGVSRQTAHQYLKGKVVPDTHRLAELVHHWGVTIDIDGHSFDKDAFPPLPSPSAAVPRHVQLSLTDLDSEPFEVALPGTQNKVRVARKGSTIELAIDLQWIA